MSISQVVALKELHESPFNPRKRFGDLSDLVASIRAVGVLEPLVVREVEKGFEIVAGCRRYRAAKQAGLTKVPVQVHKLTDAQALEVQLVENLQREDIHPLEEAEAFMRLQAEFGYTIEQICEKVGKQEGVVRASLKLLDLCEGARKAFFAGKLTASTALLIARLKGERLQMTALQHITAPNRYGDVMPYREAQVALKRLLADEAPRSPSKAVGAQLVQAVRRRMREYALGRIVERVEQKAELQPSDLRLVVTALSDGEVPEPVLKRRGLETPKQLTQKLPGMSGAELRGLLIELALLDWVSAADDTTGSRLKVAAKAFGLEYRELERTVRELMVKEDQTERAEALFKKTR